MEDNRLQNPKVFIFIYLKMLALIEIKKLIPNL